MTTSKVWEVGVNQLCGYCGLQQYPKAKGEITLSAKYNNIARNICRMGVQNKTRASVLDMNTHGLMMHALCEY